MIHRFDKARKASPVQNPDGSQTPHDQPPAPHQGGRGKYLKSIVYGGLDGIITTFAVVTGVSGADLSPRIILILGAANLFADGIAMAFGDFLSTKAENEFNSSERIREEWEVQNFPEEEKTELSEIYQEKGLSPGDSDALVDILAKYPKAMVDTMMTEELGILQDEESAFGNAVATLLSFVFFGSFPLTVYLFSEVSLVRSSGNQSLDHALLIACLITGATLFSLGAVKAKITRQNRIRSGLEMLIIGGVAAAVAYGIGAFLKGLLP